MTIRDALSESRNSLYGTDTPELDTSLLLSHAMGISREQLYMRLSDEINTEVLSVFRNAVERLNAGEPAAWVTGVKEFAGFEFSVGPGVLCPRPDSEVVCETALELMDSDFFSASERRLHDCCCGPGTLGLTLAAMRPHWNVSASDISARAAVFFKRNNAQLTGNRVAYKQADLLEGLDGPYEIIVSNPPYLTPAETESRSATGRLEPALALNGGGSDGLNLIRRLIRQAAERLIPGGALLIESSPLQTRAIRQILTDNGFHSIRCCRDLGGRERVTEARRGF